MLFIRKTIHDEVILEKKDIASDYNPTACKLFQMIIGTIVRDRAIIDIFDKQNFRRAATKPYRL